MSSTAPGTTLNPLKTTKTLSKPTPTLPKPTATPHKLPPAIIATHSYERDLTYIRYFGIILKKIRLIAFSNEVAESFRYQFPMLIKPLYMISFGYIGFDIFHNIAINVNRGKTEMFYSGLDSTIFHAVASMAIPSVIIHQSVGWSKKFFNHYKFSSKVSIRAPICIGIGLIPLIIHPIDEAVHKGMVKYVRPLYPIDIIEEHK